MNTDTHDAWLRADSVAAALTLRQALTPVDGPDGILFPPTYAKGEDRDGFKGGYNLDRGPDGSGSVCLVDSVGSQANRIEPLFKRAPYAALVPQIEVALNDDTVVNLLDAGHRAGDAVVRCSSLQDSLGEAFKALSRGNAEPLAKLAPTSLVFGVWDSRATQTKAPRLVASTIRAFGVTLLSRSAQYSPAARYAELELIPEPPDEASRKLQSVRGFVDVPATGTHGGIIAKEIRRDAQLHLAALRLLIVRDDPGRTLALRRYILGLALVALSAPPPCYLRAGCNLIPAEEGPLGFQLAQSTGARGPFPMTHEAALAYAQAAAAEFGVGSSQRVPFDKARAAKDLEDAKPKKKNK